MFDRILCVCTGNLCRSPMAMGLLGERLEDRVVESAGTAAVVGEPATPHVVELLAERGIDIGDHRARVVTPELLYESDLVLAAEDFHVRTLLRLAPEVRGRVFRLGHWRDVDVADPIGGSRADYVECLELIEGCVDDWMESLRAGVARDE